MEVENTHKDNKENKDIQTGYVNSIDQIKAMVRAHVPIIWVVTHEEERFINELSKEIGEALKKEIWTWSSYQGIIKYTGETVTHRASGEWDKTWNAQLALEKINGYKYSSDKRGAIFVLKDFHTVLTQPVPRQMRDMYISLVDSQKTLIIVSPCLAHGPSGRSPGIEPTLDKQVTVVEYELPDHNYIVERAKETINHVKENNPNPKTSKTKLDYSDEEYRVFGRALQGMTEVEIDNALFTCLSHIKRIDERRLLHEKKQVVKRTDILEYIEQSPMMEDVGGLDEAKKYFTLYADQFDPEAKEFGVEPLRGVLLTGVPGTGKSLLAKAIAACWKLPLLRLDVGKVMTGLVGGSEEKMRMVINQTEAIAPCILWIDEIEKSLSGTKSSNFSDGGTLARVFGTLLTAMEERFEGVVVVATANDISALPPELIRRFNEVFFVDLPVPEEREEVLRIHLKKRGRNLEDLDIDVPAVIAASHMFTGSEIEKAVKEAITRAWRDGKREVNTQDLVGAMKDTKAIAKVMGEKIGQIRDWARDRARYASSLAAANAAPGAQKVTTSGGTELDLASDLDDLDEVVKTDKKEKTKETSHKGRQVDLLDD